VRLMRKSVPAAQPIERRVFQEQPTPGSDEQRGRRQTVKCTCRRWREAPSRHDGEEASSGLVVRGAQLDDRSEGTEHDGRDRPPVGSQSRQ